MKLIDQYVLFRFLKIIAVALLSFILVVVIVDLIENIDKFIDHKAPVHLVVLYYIYYIPFIIILALPVAVLLSTMFTVGSLARYHELEVIKSTGISLYRLSVPLLLAGLVISIAAIVFSDVIMVPANFRKDQLKSEEIEKRSSRNQGLRQNVIKAARDGWIVYARLYNEIDDTGESVVIQQIKDNEVTEAIKADRMVWSDSGWLLINVTERTFNKGEESGFGTFDTLNARFLPHTPEVMKHRQKNPRDTRFFELLKLIDMKKWMKQDTAKEKVELYLKFSVPFSNLIVIILGIPLAANPRRSGGTVGFGLSIIISFIYFVILRAGQSFGYNHSLPPLLAATLGDIIFLIIGVGMFLKARK
jgi:lipopolysaccharide export system permease protein